MSLPGKGFRIASALLVAGCSAGPPLALYTPAADQVGEERTAAVLVEALERQKAYGERFDRLSRRSGLWNVPLIGAAAATAAMLYGNAGRDALFAVGLGAGSYVALRSTLEPAGLAELYLKAHGAAGCIRRHGAHFSGDTALGIHDSAGERLGALARAMLDAEEAALQSPPAGADEAGFRATQLRLRDQLGVARTVLDAGRRELAAFGTAPDVLSVALETLDRQVASRGRLRAEVNVSALAQTLLAAGTAAIPAAPSPPPPDAASGLAPPATGPADALRALVIATDAARDATPAYAARLVEAAQCPTQLGG